MRYSIGIFLAVTTVVFLLDSCSTPTLPDEVETAMQQVPDEVDFTYDVKPILSDRCFACHGPDKAKKKAGLRLDTPDAFDKQCEGGRKAIVPGDLAASDVFHRIIATDPDVVMPTPDSHLSLSAQEKAVLIKWIQQGAEYKPHWSLAKV